MLIRIFRAAWFLQYLLLFVLAGVLWGLAYVYPYNFFSGGSFTLIKGLDALIVSNPYLSLSLMILMLIGEAVLLNAILGIHRLTHRNQLVAAAVYLVLMGSSPLMVQPNIMLVINLLMIILLHIVLNLYGQQEPYSRLFDAGVLLGIASLLYLPAIFFIFFLLVSLMIFQIFHWREWLIPIIGLAAPFAFVAVWFFWTDQLVMQYDFFITKFTFILPEMFPLSTAYLAIWLLLLLLFFMGLPVILRLFNDNSADLRKKFRVVAFMLIFSLLSAFFAGADLKWHLHIAIIPLTVFITVYFIRHKRSFWGEIIITLIFVAAIAARVLMAFQ
ncbi:MAG: hypothetical protein EOM83_08780 [Clostridia bacterium]|nr:hypothetical protein [Clostridia bacterium]